MIPINDEEIKSYENQKVYHICKDGFCIYKNEKSYLNYTTNSEITAITQENLEELLIIFAI